MAKKLIEVALPPDAINAAAAQEKSIRHGHPSTLHLWRAPRRDHSSRWGPVSPLAFRRDWLANRDLDPTQCVVIEVMGDSMEPTLPKGSSILVDRARQRPQKGHIYVVRTGDGVVVKRLKRKDGVWMMTSDNPEPEHSSTRLASETEVIGEVRWMARSIR